MPVRSPSPVFLALGLLLMLTGCGTAVQTGVTLTPPDTPGGRACTIECIKAHESCQESCTLTHRTCVGQIQQQAMQDYDAYIRQQIMSHQPTDLRARDFERTGSCDSTKTTCNGGCENTYQACYETCGGQIEHTTSCQFLCF